MKTVKINSESLKEYVRLYRDVEIIYCKKDKPIFVLKGLERPAILLGRPDEIIIKGDKFIIPSKSKASGSRTISDAIPSGNDYLNSLREKRSSKEFSIKSILDKDIKLSDKTYIRPLRDFFRKYGVLEEKRGPASDKYKKIYRERRQFIIASYREICRKRGRKTPLPLKKISYRLNDYARERTYSNDPYCAKKEKKIFDVKEVTIRRILQSYIKK